MISPACNNFNSSFVNVSSLRDIEGEPVLRCIHKTRRRGASAAAMWCVYNLRGAT